jgi:hypothetical protein
MATQNNNNAASSARTRNANVKLSIDAHASLVQLKLHNFPEAECKVTLTGVGRNQLLVTVKLLTQLGRHMVESLGRDVNQALIAWLQVIENSNVLRWLNLHKYGVQYLSESPVSKV